MCPKGEAWLVWSLLLGAVCSLCTGHPIQPTEMKVVEAHQRYKECPQDVCRGLPCYNYEVYLLNPLEKESLCTCLPCGHPTKPQTVTGGHSKPTAGQNYLSVTSHKSHYSNDNNKGSFSKVRRYRRSPPVPPHIPKEDMPEAPGVYVPGQRLFSVPPPPKPDVPPTHPVIDPLPVLAQF